MSAEMNTNTCTCKGRLLIPFNMLALSFGVVIATSLADSLKIKGALERQAQQAGAQGQQVAAARDHYFGLYSDLVSLSAKDEQAAAIVQKYGIKLNQPAPAAQPAAQPAAKTTP